MKISLVDGGHLFFLDKPLLGIHVRVSAISVALDKASEIQWILPVTRDLYEE